MMPLVEQLQGDVWVVRVEQPGGKVQEYRCTTEQQARQLALVLAPRPDGGPPRPGLRS
ncbi:MAG: hypothetical protein INH41_14965 [Myxococcaceae bacterium]|jgi:hypothetical protein|nr:hypothetical protein [Myxococcaceae bacterium]MCA3013681.1 hypothetical protein [Myxococcaceae bacterium]